MDWFNDSASWRLGRCHWSKATGVPMAPRTAGWGRFPSEKYRVSRRSGPLPPHRRNCRVAGSATDCTICRIIHHRSAEASKRSSPLIVQLASRRLNRTGFLRSWGVGLVRDSLVRGLQTETQESAAVQSTRNLHREETPHVRGLACRAEEPLDADQRTN